MAASPAGQDARDAVFMLVDGARVDVVEHLLAIGDLPNFARLLIEPGTFTTGTTVFPSTTGVAYVPFLFGCYPGTADVPGIRWLDRVRAAGNLRTQWLAARTYCGVQGGLINRDITAASPSIFDLVPESLAFCTPITRGLGPGRVLVPVKRAILGSIAHYTGTYQWLDDAVARAWIGTASRRDWRFQFVVFPGPDGIAHLRDPWHPNVLNCIRAIDTALGEFDRAVRRHRPSPLYVAAADHGSTPIREHTDIALQFEDWGMPALRHPASIWRRNASVAVMVSGNASAHVYIDPRSGRTEPLDSHSIPDGFVERLVELPAVRLAAFRDGDGGVCVVSKAGTALLSSNAGVITCEAVRGDAIGLGATTVVAPDREMLALSRETDLPDAPAQLIQLLRSERSGDIVLAADNGFDFRTRWENPEHRSGHGSLVADHMNVPILANIALPDVPIRTVDLMPAMVEGMGLRPPEGIDGLRLGEIACAAQHPGATDRT